MYLELIDVAAKDEVWGHLPDPLDTELCIQLFEAPEPLPLTEELTFRIGTDCLERDYLPVQKATGWLCSQKFIDVLVKASVPFTAYPARLLEYSTDQPLAASYFFWIPVRLRDAIDMERSRTQTDTTTGGRWFVSLVLTKECEQTAPLLFHARGNGRYFVHDTLRTQFVEAGVTGLDFAPLDAALQPGTGIKKQALLHSLQQHPDDWGTWAKLGDVFVRLGYDEEAVNSFQHSLALSDADATVWYKYGRLLYRLGHFADALEALTHATDIQPESAAWGEYCATLRKLGRIEEAFTCARQWVERCNRSPLWKRSPLPWYELGAAYTEMKRYDDAIRSFDTSLDRGGGARLEDIYRLLGSVLTTVKRYEEALEVYETALQTHPLKTHFWEGKKTALEGLGRYHEAEIAGQEMQKLEQMRAENLKRRPL